MVWIDGEKILIYGSMRTGVAESASLTAPARSEMRYSCVRQGRIEVWEPLAQPSAGLKSCSLSTSISFPASQRGSRSPGIL
jgi:hypothetical protein